MLTLLVAAEKASNSPTGTPATSDLESALRQIMEGIRAACAGRELGLRMLTDQSTGTCAAVAKMATESGIQLHFLDPSCPPAHTAAKGPRAERTVWLGATPADLAGGEPRAVCDEIGLALAGALLVAWDGVIDGTAPRLTNLMLQAVAAMKPVLWIDPAGAIRAFDLTTMTVGRRHLLQCPQGAGAMLLEGFGNRLDGPSLLLRISEICAVVMMSSSPESEPTDSAQIGFQPGAIHRAMTALVQGQFWKVLRAFSRGSQRAHRGPAWDAATDLIAATPVLDASFDAADIQATSAAGKHRSAAWISAVSATAAVFAAVAGAISLWPGTGGALWGILELVLIATVVGLLWHARQQNWHKAWTANRFVAEQTRYARMGLPLLAFTKSSLEPWMCVLRDKDGVSRLGILSPDLGRLHRAIADEGLPQSVDGTPYTAATEASLPRLRDFVLAVVDDQVHYQHRIHVEQHAIHHRFDMLSLVFFCSTAVAVIAHFVLHASWLLIFTGFFPALAAGLHGLATTLEISRVADQSKTTMGKLQHIRDALTKALDSPSTTWQKWARLRYLTLLAAEVMSDENNQWQKLLDHQKPRLPA